MNKKIKLGFSVLDVFLIVLAAVCVLSFVFRDQIRGFLSGEEGVEVEYTFLVQNASQEARNIPEVGEEMYLSRGHASLGTLTQVAVSEKEYHGSCDEEDEDIIKIKTLTCKATAKAKLADRGYVVGNTVIKQGAELKVETENASFTLIVMAIHEKE